MYWSCLLISKQADKQVLDFGSSVWRDLYIQRTGLSQISSICIGMRKLVDDLYRPIRAGDTERTTSAEIDLSDPHVSLLSYLIMLKTLKPGRSTAVVMTRLCPSVYPSVCPSVYHYYSAASHCNKIYCKNLRFYLFHSKTLTAHLFIAGNIPLVLSAQ